jgi:LPS export ABC transporter protein LptC
VIGRILIGLVIIAIVIGGLFMSQGPGAALTRKPTDTPADVPGYSARNAVVVETGDDGRPAYTLNSPLVRQRANDDRVQLASPRMTFLASDGTTWHISARAGQIQADGSNVNLFGDVKFNGLVSALPVTIATSIMSFDTQNEIARTPAPVTFDWNGGRLAGTGLLANLKDSTVRLESRVNGTFPPK